jgi:hypothetical protein
MRTTVSPQNSALRGRFFAGIHPPVQITADTPVRQRQLRHVGIREREKNKPCFPKIPATPVDICTGMRQPVEFTSMTLRSLPRLPSSPPFRYNVIVSILSSKVKISTVFSKTQCPGCPVARLPSQGIDAAACYRHFFFFALAVLASFVAAFAPPFPNDLRPR